MADSELEAALERLKACEQARAEAFANVSHELRTPLALILGPTRDLLEHGELSPAVRRALEVVSRNARLLEKRVDDLLMVAKGESGELELKPHYQEAELGELVASCCENFQAYASENGYRFEIAWQPLHAELDVAMLERVVINLLSNAFKFTPEGGWVRCAVRSEVERRWAIIEVSDDGPGIPSERREEVFERFRQLDTGPTKKTGGFGLGLAIVRRLVDLHRGEIAIGESEHGGARFTIGIPLDAPPAAIVDRDLPWSSRSQTPASTFDIEEIPDDGELPATDGERPRVLVVENNPQMNRFVRECLGGEYATAAAYDGAQGLARIAELNPDLVITDLMMPRMSGLEMVAALRERSDALPVLVLSARDEDPLRAELLRAGALDYVTKPFSVDELRARVRNLVIQKRARDVLSRELKDQQLDLEALARQVVGASHIKSNFLRMMAHELRTPVTAIQLQLALFERRLESNREHQPLIDRLQRTTRRLLELIESSLEYARIESGKFELRGSSFSLEELAKDALLEFGPHAEQKGIALHFRGEDAIPPLSTDRDLVRLIAANLVGNAVKYTEQGEVEIRIGRAAGEQLLIVRDTGPGIPPDKQEEIFEPFHQLGDIRRLPGPGSGLGLWLVSEMVRALGGRIGVSSETGKGSTFIVALPERAVETQEVTS